MPLWLILDVIYTYHGPGDALKIALLQVPPSAWLLGLTQVDTANDRSIGSTVYAGLTVIISYHIISGICSSPITKRT